jgi:O-acetyl-ADP-ribose deacetylase (regulator of RNase III)
MRTVVGDLFESDTGAIGHGVNTKGVMGSGIAVPFRNMFPDMFKIYKDRCKDGSLKPGGCFPYVSDTGLWVYNIASQDEPGPNARWEWLASGAAAALLHASAWNIFEGKDSKEIAIPRIGCGIGGLEWKTVASVLEQVERKSGTDITFVVYIHPNDVEADEV